jgi:hypothetical protein
VIRIDYSGIARGRGVAGVFTDTKFLYMIDHTSEGKCMAIGGWGCTSPVFFKT